jgi:zinc protease
VLFLADRKAPIATVQVFYHVGSKDESPGRRGIAHMFEHMMFKGTARVPPEEHARMLKEVGGIANAYTTEDLTVYHQTIPPSYVGFALELEADRMRNLRLVPATVDAERKVVIEEKQLRIDNSPIGQALETFRATAFERHPYRWTAAGVLEDLQKLSVDDCRRFYDAYYQPNNATLVIVGDLGEGEVRRLVERHFGAIPRGTDPPRVIVSEPPQTKPRDRTLERPVELPVMIGGYHIPRAGHPDLPALRVLAAVLAEGESSRLHRRLVRGERLAVAAGGVTEALEDAGLFMVFALHLPDRDAARIRQVLFEEIATIRREAVSAEELERAKNQLAAQHVYGLEGVDGIAGQLGEARYVLGDWRRFLEGAERYLAVTAADVTRVAGTYLRDEGLTLVTLRPRGAQAGPGRTGVGR